ncbi:lyase family protein [Sphingomonas sp. MMS24-JH45]
MPSRSPSGEKLAEAHAEFRRNRARLVAAREDIATCAISGAVGTFANVDPRVEAHVAAKLGLAIEPVSTQVIPRDRHAMFFTTLGVIAGSIERVAVEIRHLQRTGAGGGGILLAGQKGSSAMPHKRNPVLTENLTGLARMVRLRHSRAGERGAVARARHRPLRRSSAASGRTRRSRSTSRWHG